MFIISKLRLSHPGPFDIFLNKLYSTVDNYKHKRSDLFYSTWKVYPGVYSVKNKRYVEVNR